MHDLLCFQQSECEASLLTNEAVSAVAFLFCFICDSIALSA